MRVTCQGFGRREILALIVVLIAGAGALAFWTQQKILRKNIDTTVLCNVRQLSAAADQYFLENGVSTLRLEDIVGPKKYLQALATVDGETYPAVYVRGVTITVTGIAGTRTVTYAP